MTIVAKGKLRPSKEFKEEGLLDIRSWEQTNFRENILDTRDIIVKNHIFENIPRVLFHKKLLIRSSTLESIKNQVM